MIRRYRTACRWWIVACLVGPVGLIHGQAIELVNEGTMPCPAISGVPGDTTFVAYQDVYAACNATSYFDCLALGEGTISERSCLVFRHEVSPSEGYWFDVTVDTVATDPIYNFGADVWLSSDSVQWTFLGTSSQLLFLNRHEHYAATVSGYCRIDGAELFVKVSPHLEPLYSVFVIDRIDIRGESRGELTLTSGPWGSVTQPGEGTFLYRGGDVVLPIQAASDSRQTQFAGWTGSAVDRGLVQDPCSADTTVFVKMGTHYDLRATFVWAPLEIYVDDDAPTDPAPGDSTVGDPLEDGTRAHPYDSIGEAMDVAMDLDTVVVLPGVYAGLGHDVPDTHGQKTTIRSSDGPSDCILDLAEVSTAIELADGITLEGFTLCNARDGQPAILCRESSSVAIRNCVFQDNAGSAITGCGAEIEITGCLFRNNAGSAVHMTGFVFQNEFGITHITEGHIEIAECLFESNVGGESEFQLHAPWRPKDNEKGDGGAILCDNSSCVITGCTFVGNEAGAGGAISSTRSEMILRECTFQRNRAAHGAAILLDMSLPVTIAGCTFEANKGQAVELYPATRVTIQGCLFRNNTGSAIQNGPLAHLRLDQRPLEISDCTFLANYDTALTGGDNANVVVSNTIFALNANGAIHSFQSHTDTAVTDCVFFNNTVCDLSYDLGSSSVSYTGAEEINARVPSAWGNVSVDPALTPDGHLLSGSPCIDALAVSAETPDSEMDIDGDARLINERLDIGADEFIDGDADELPDWWERQYFDDPNAADPDDDPDGDGLSNLDEYALFGSHPVAGPLFVDPIDGNDVWDGLASAAGPEGGGPKRTIQAALDVAHDGDTILLRAGHYTGLGNRDLTPAREFIVLYAPDGPDHTILDCQQAGRGFDLCSSGSSSMAVIGLTITGGRAEYGSALQCQRAGVQLHDCVITGNHDIRQDLGAVYGYHATLTFGDCTLEQNSPRECFGRITHVEVLGTVDVGANGWGGWRQWLAGQGALQLGAETLLDVADSRIQCNVFGAGTVHVGIDSELVFEHDATIDLGSDDGPNGRILCEGLLRLKDTVALVGAHINVTRASFEDNAIITNCVVTAEAGAPYGQFYLEDNVIVQANEIHADGDRYMDLDPEQFAGLMTDNRIYVTITEGTDHGQGGLFELRGLPTDDAACSFGQFVCQLPSVPNWDTENWTIDRLELVAGSKLNLTNRFDFHEPYDVDGDREVLYVKELVMGPDAVLNTAFNHVYYETLVMDPTAQIVNVPLLGFSLNNISFDDENEYFVRVKHNNFRDPKDPAYDRVHVERRVGSVPDLDGMMRLRNLAASSVSGVSSGPVIHARAKGFFAKSNESNLTVRLEYLFDTCDPDVELIVYLSDVPELLDKTDADREEHYLEIARIAAPPVGCPGSAGSGRFGVFQESVSREHLEFTAGTRIELELVGPVGACVLIDNWDPQVHCSEIYCGDVTGDLSVTAMDFLTVVASFGSLAGLTDTGGSHVCLDGLFSANGVIDTSDITSWDWFLNAEDRLSLCAVPMASEMTIAPSPLGKSKVRSFKANRPVTTSAHPEGLWVVGKRTADHHAGKLVDRLCAFDPQGNLTGRDDLAIDRGHMKLIADRDGRLYHLNSEEGLVRLSDGSVVVPPATVTVQIEPRYGLPADITIGLHCAKGRWYGRPIADAAFDSDGHLYVAPVVVSPVGQSPYAAAARIDPSVGTAATCELVTVYDDPPPEGDNRHRNSLQTIEVDDQGNLFVLNSHSLNESDILWVYDTTTGALKRRVFLTHPANSTPISAPGALCASARSPLLYLTSSNNLSEATTATLFGLSRETFEVERLMQIDNIGHITDIAEDPHTGDLWVVGFIMEHIPEYLSFSGPPFYCPRVARVPHGDSGPVQAYHPPGDHDLALPLSVLWNGRP